MWSSGQDSRIPQAPYITCLALGVLLFGFQPAGAQCVAIPSAHPVFAGDKLEVKSNVKVNGSSVSSGTNNSNSAIKSDGSRISFSQSLAALNPSSFPNNSSSLEADEDDSPFHHTSQKYYKEIEVDEDETVTFTGGGPFHIEKLEVKKESTIKLAAGTYYVDEFKLNDEVELIVTSTPVYLHIGDKLELKKEVEMNKSGTVAGLVVYLHDDAELKIDKESEFVGAVYGPQVKKVELKEDVVFRGVIVIDGDVKLDKKVAVTYTSSHATTVAAICSTPPPSAVMFCEGESNHALSAGSTLKISANVKVNTNAVSSGTTNANSVLKPDGTRATVSQSLAALNPASFPSNTETRDRDDDDSPFTHTSAAYYDNITIRANKTGVFSGGGPFHIDRLLVKKDGKAKLAAGTYYIRELKFQQGNTQLIVTSTPVILHIKSTFTVSKTSNINDGGSVTGLQVYLHDNAQFITGRDIRFFGLIYGPDATKVKFNKNATIRGMVAIGGEIEVKQNSNITFNSADAAAVTALGNCTSTGHFAIAHDGSGINCQAEPVTVTAHKDDHTTNTAYTGTASLSTSTNHGDWSLVTGNGTLTNSGAGAATYAFASADNGTVSLGLKNTFAETVNIAVTDGTISQDSGEAAALTFAASGFRFLADGSANAIGTQIAAKPSSTAPGAQTVELQAIKTSDNTGQCEAALTGTQVVQLGSECVDPSSCAATKVEVNSTAVSSNSSGSVSNYTNVSLDFGGAGDSTATLVLQYDEAGKIRMHARKALLLANGSASGNTMVGSSNAFVVRPFGFDVDFSDDRQNNGTGGSSYATNASSSVFAKAGAPFATTVTAYGWQSADDSNDDGVPDSGANLTNNTVTTRFGAESSAPTVAITATKVQPSAGVLGSLSGGANIGGFSSGVRTVNLNYAEVGIIHLSALHSNYLSGGQNITGEVRQVGRFIPARFNVSANSPNFHNGPNGSWTCNFTYLGQDFSFATNPVFTLSAFDVNGNSIKNYGGSFWRYVKPTYLGGRSYADLTGKATLDAPTLGTVALAGHTDFNDGQGTLTVSGERLVYSRAATPVEPFVGSVKMTLAGSDLVDLDGVCYHPSDAQCNTNDASSNTSQAYVINTIGAPNMRFGRAAMGNAAGSELLSLQVPMTVESFQSGGFSLNSGDNCTNFGTAFIDLSNNAANPPMGTLSIAVGSQATTAGIANQPVSSGVAGLTFTAPGQGGVGYADATFNLSVSNGADMKWLRFDWDGDGNHDDDPQGRGTFGIYSGSDRVIIIREPWN